MDIKYFIRIGTVVVRIELKTIGTIYQSSTTFANMFVNKMLDDQRVKRRTEIIETIVL